MAKKLISICVPVLNEFDNIDLLISTLLGTTSALTKYKFEYVFSDNNSSDGTWEKIVKYNSKNKSIKGIRFSTNIGYQNSILQNYFYASGDAVIQIDADLQDPPSMIENFLIEWEKGYKVVYGIRNIRKGSQVDRFVRKIGYKILNWASDKTLHKDVGDFRLIDRTVIEVLRQRNYTNPYLRGIISSLGFKESGIQYAREVRKVGKSKFTAVKVMKLGFVGLLSFSTKPIRMFIPISIFFLSLSMFGVFWIIFLYLVDSNLPRGFTTTQILLFTIIGLNSIFAALAGDYLHKIYNALNPIKVGYISESI
jgi:dolichol-phosphate mannosyltransferase